MYGIFWVVVGDVVYFFGWWWVVAGIFWVVVGDGMVYNIPFLNDHIKMTVYFIKNDDLILFHFNMKKLNMFNFLQIKMMKTFLKLSDTIVLSERQREICIPVYVFT